MWFHLTNIRLYLPNNDNVGETLHSQAFIDLVTAHGGRSSYVLECPEHPSEYTFLTAWDHKEEADTFFASDVYKDFVNKLQPQLVAPVCERHFEVMLAGQTV